MMHRPCFLADVVRMQEQWDPEVGAAAAQC